MLAIQNQKSEFDRVGGLGFAFDVFCITLLFLASQSLLVLNFNHMILRL